MNSNPAARLPQSDFAEASVFGEAIQDTLRKGVPLETTLRQIADSKIETLSEATSAARNIARGALV